MSQIIVDPMPVFVDGGIHFTVHSLTAEDDRVAAEVESLAELTSGAVYNNHYHMLFFFRGDKIVEVREWDAVRVPPGTWRGYEAGPEGLEILVFGAPNLGENPRGDVEGERDWWHG